MGPVVVDAAGEVFGDAPNVASRVQGAAEPGAVLVTAAVHRQTTGLFVAEDRGLPASAIRRRVVSIPRQSRGRFRVRGRQSGA